MPSLARVMPAISVFIVVSLLRLQPLPPLYVQKSILHRRIAFKVGAGAGPDHPAFFDDDMAVGKAGQRVDVLVDHQDGLVLGLEPPQAIPDLEPDQRREALGG